MLDPAQDPNVFLLDTQACKRLYKREFLRQRRFRFAEGFIFEDVPAHYRLLCDTNRLLLVDQPFYYYRFGHPGRITDRTDQQLLQVIEIMLRVESTLQNFGAGPEVWANFIWYQDWVLRWLGGQIEERFAQMFARGACGIARRFPAVGVEMFRHKFRTDEHSQTGVRVQISGCEDAYYELLRGSTQ